MNTPVHSIALTDLALAFIPVVLVIGILFKWSLHAGYALYAISRMLAQLLIIGYFLAYLFAADSAWLIIAVLTLMACFSSWIALGSVTGMRYQLYLKAVFAILLGSGSTLWLITQGVLKLQPWYFAQYMIPLGGMIFANSMNSVSLAAERLDAEISRNLCYRDARNIALNAALIPVINSLLAVGLVSLPGMMTGQILSGVSPFIAARYQIMVMCMVFGSAGLSTACFLILVKREFTNHNHQ